MSKAYKLIPIEESKRVIINGPATIVTKSYLIVYNKGNLKETIASFEVKGVSKCNETDDYNEVTGLRLAESRLHKAALKVMIKILEEKLQNVNDLQAELTSSLNKFYLSEEQETDHIKDLA